MKDERKNCVILFLLLFDLLQLLAFVFFLLWPSVDPFLTPLSRSRLGRMNPPWPSSRCSYQISGWSTFASKQPVFLLFTKQRRTCCCCFTADPPLMFWSSSKKSGKQVIHNSAQSFSFSNPQQCPPFTLLQVFPVLSSTFCTWQKTFLTWNLSLCSKMNRWNYNTRSKRIPKGKWWRLLAATQKPCECACWVANFPVFTLSERAIECWILLIQQQQHNKQIKMWT